MRRLAIATALVAGALFAVPAAGQDLAAGREAYRRQDFATALVELHPLARSGTAEAQFLVAMMYSNGFGVQKNREEAANWYGLAARQGHPVAQLHLGFYFRRGYGVPEDRVMSYMWTALSAELGHTEAIEWRDKVALEMTAPEIALARRLADDWLAKFRGARETAPTSR
jgi:TPR repeat protein